MFASGPPPESSNPLRIKNIYTSRGAGRGDCGRLTLVVVHLVLMSYGVHLQVKQKQQIIYKRELGIFHVHMTRQFVPSVQTQTIPHPTNTKIPPPQQSNGPTIFSAGHEKKQSFSTHDGNARGFGGGKNSNNITGVFPINPLVITALSANHPYSHSQRILQHSKVSHWPKHSCSLSDCITD